MSTATIPFGNFKNYKLSEILYPICKVFFSFRTPSAALCTSVLNNFPTSTTRCTIPCTRTFTNRNATFSKNCWMRRMATKCSSTPASWTPWCHTRRFPTSSRTYAGRAPRNTSWRIGSCGRSTMTLPDIRKPWEIWSTWWWGMQGILRAMTNPSGALIWLTDSPCRLANQLIN